MKGLEASLIVALAGITVGSAQPAEDQMGSELAELVPFLRAFAAGEGVTLAADFWTRLSRAKDKAELFRLGLLSGLSLAPLQQAEVDALVLRNQGTELARDLAIYIAGRFASEQAAMAYLHLQARTLTQGGGQLGALTAAYVQSKVAEVVAHARAHSENPYFQKIASALSEETLAFEAQEILAQEGSLQVVQAFAGLLAAEFAVKWLQAYVAERNPVEWEPLLQALPADVVALAGQLALARSKDRASLLAAYTLAVSKNKAWAEPLNALVQDLIEKCSADVFEAFLPENKGRLVDDLTPLLHLSETSHDKSQGATKALTVSRTSSVSFFDE